MKPTLSKLEVDQLFEFVQSKNVQYIDMQHEIVDHLASAIEEKQEANPNLSFDKALNDVFKGFPITGFSKIIDSKQSALANFWTKKFFKFMLNYIKPPLILTTIIYTYLIHLLLTHPNETYKLGLYLFVIIYLTGCYYYRNYLAYQFDTNKVPNYLISLNYKVLLEISHLLLIIPTSLVWVFLSEPSNMTNNPLISWSVSLFFTLFLLWVHAMSFEFPKMLQQEIKEKYSHLNIA